MIIVVIMMMMMMMMMMMIIIITTIIIIIIIIMMQGQANSKRNIIRFKPPFSKNEATKIERYFLNLVDKHFPRDHKFYIFNRNNIKVTVACRILNWPSTHTTEKSFTHLLTAKVEHVTALRKQTALYKKNA